MMRAVGDMTDLTVKVVETTGPRNLLGMAVAQRIGGSQTREHFAIFEVSAPPGSSVPLHTHREAEVFYILSGDVEFGRQGRNGPETFTASAGRFVLIPAGQIHSFRNTGASEARVLVIAEASMEVFFAEACDPVTREPQGARPPAESDIHRVLKIMEHHGQVLVGPHPGSV